MKRLKSPEFMARFHAAMTVLWLILLIPSVIWWSQSVPWLVLISVWANITGHWASFQACQGEKRTKEQE